MKLLVDTIIINRVIWKKEEIVLIICQSLLQINFSMRLSIITMLERALTRLYKISFPIIIYIIYTYIEILT